MTSSEEASMPPDQRRQGSELMDDQQSDAIVDRQLRGAQIIALALLSGALTFLAIALLVPLGIAWPQDQEPVLTWISLGVGAVLLVLALVVPDVIGRRQRRLLRSAPAQIAGRHGPIILPPPGPARDAYAGAASFLVRLLVRLALLEGGTFLALIVHLLERQWPSLVLAVLLMGLMAANFPTRDRLERWLNQRDP